ncbi:MAG TPA: hypothetical protein VGE18_03425 [Candidatus Paceibacterota bacterium]
MKKTVITAFAFLLSFGLFMPTAFAGGSTSFNNDSRDLPTVTITNDSDDHCSAGPADGCWSTSTTARPGDLVSVQIYYHNTGNSSATEVSVGLTPKNSSSKTTHTFRGGVAVGSEMVASGSASVRLSEGATLNYVPGSVRWFPNQSTSGRTISGETYIFTSDGLNVGTIAPGWNGQGTVVVDFRVGEGEQEEEDRPQCDDDIDNDDDGRIDYPSDPGCSSRTDDNEYNSTPDPEEDECEIESFTADDYSIEEGDSTTLRWRTTSDCDYVRISYINGNLSEDGSTNVRPTSDRTYTLTSYPGGDTDTVRISVDEEEEDREDECDIDTFKSNDYSIERGDTATLTWKVTGADRVEINGVSKNKSGSMSVSPYSSTVYRIDVRGDGCDDQKSLTISVSNADQNARPQAITTIASILSSTAAQLNGIAVPNTTSGSTTAWFEWGPSTNVQYRTSSKNVGTGASSIPYSDVVNGLVPGTTYYYRAVVQNQNGTAYGDIVNFRTQNIVQGTTVVTQPTRVIVQSQTIRDSVTAESVASLLELRIESAYDHMCIGGEIEYVVTYRNISPVTLEDTVLRIALPRELTYVGADRGKYDPIDQILTLDIGRVQPGEQGSVTVRARVNENAIRGNLTVLTATVVYTNPNTRAQEDAIAYSLITVSDECPTVLGASVFGFGSFLPDTLLEWLLLILVILALILLGRNLYKKKEEQKA